MYFKLTKRVYEPAMDEIAYSPGKEVYKHS